MPNDFTNAELFALFERHGFITRSQTMVPIFRKAWRAAAVSDLNVLLEGETGTGKQVLAQAIHNLDEKRRKFPFIVVHCAAIAEGIAESELFGHQRGAFSGATRDRKGLFQAAHGGTLLLDDVNDLPMALQPKLLDVLQRGIVRGVGSDRETAVNVRVIAAANEPLAQRVRERRFRADLYHRLNVVHLQLPPLRERSEDLADLLLAFASRHRHIYPNVTHVDPRLVEYLERHSFDGNVRELEHAVERALFTKTEGSSLQLEDWSKDGAKPAESEAGLDLISEAAERMWTATCKYGLAYGDALRALERGFLEAALRACDTRREMASRMQTSERTLYHKLHTHNLTRNAGPQTYPVPQPALRTGGRAP